MTVPLLRKKFTVAEFQQMADAGILQEEDRVELIEGEIIEMGRIGSKHASFVDRTADLFRDRLGKRVIVRVQNPIQLDRYSQPQPDIALVVRREDYYESGHPLAPDIFLVVEVADTTLQSDREVKIPLYAKNGIVEAWLVNIEENCLEVYRYPTASGYLEFIRFSVDREIALASFPDITFPVGEIFPETLSA